jgi:hypothetical protein
MQSIIVPYSGYAIYNIVTGPGTSMPHYRFYVLDEHRQLVGVVNLDCTDDDAAKKHANQLADGHEVELWRLVVQIGPSPKRRRKPS